MKTYLKRIPLEGEETGKKASAADVCSAIRAQRDGSGSGSGSGRNILSAIVISNEVYFSYRILQLPLLAINVMYSTFPLVMLIL